VARDLHAPLAELAAASRLRERLASREVLVAAYLVETDAVAEFRGRIHELGARQEDLQVIVTGPWPPYNFASEKQQ
jgi:Gas vesicle synthesis protein GvpL/GvpF